MKNYGNQNQFTLVTYVSLSFVLRCIDNSFQATFPLVLACLDANKDASINEQSKVVGWSGPTFGKNYQMIMCFYTYFGTA